MTGVTPIALLIGFICPTLFKDGVFLVPWLFALVMFVMALGCDFKQLAHACRSPRIIGYVLLVSHGVMPLFAWGMGRLFFGAHSPFVIGLLLFAIIPLGVSSIMWVGLVEGQIALVLGLVIVDTLLSPMIVPNAMQWFIGATVHLDLVKMMKDLVFLLVLPTVAGVSLQSMTNGRAKVVLGERLAPWSKLAFAGVLVINAATIKPYLTLIKGNVFLLCVVAFLLIVFGYGLGYLSPWFKIARHNKETLSYALGMRNISLGLVIALHYFEPLAAVPVVLTIFMQQPLAALHYSVIKRFKTRGG
jgi:predicted Na+-dependent transporter